MIENDAEHVLDEQQIQQIFQPFYRPDYSRNRKRRWNRVWDSLLFNKFWRNTTCVIASEAVDGKQMRFIIFSQIKKTKSGNGIELNETKI